jgi:hypothetical protein
MSLNSPPGKTVVALNSGAGRVTNAEDMAGDGCENEVMCMATSG